MVTETFTFSCEFNLFGIKWEDDFAVECILNENDLPTILSMTWLSTVVDTAGDGRDQWTTRRVYVTPVIPDLVKDLLVVEIAKRREE